jgi:hypothetical protein
MATLTATQKDALAALLRGKTPCCSAETFWTLEALGHVIDVLGDYELTESGRAVATERAASQDKARIRRNEMSRGRADAMRSLGLTRCRNGMWE